MSLPDEEALFAAVNSLMFERECQAESLMLVHDTNLLPSAIEFVDLGLKPAALLVAARWARLT